MKSVGFSHASTPFENVRTVTPISRISRRDSIVAGLGFRLITWPTAPVSFQAVTVACSALVNAACSSAFEGMRMPGFCGETATRIRLSSASSSLASVAASLSVIAGRS